MGKQGDIKLRGTVENIIYYQWKGIHCMRTVPEKVRQTKPTKKAASDFGLAVKSAAAVRAMLRPVLPNPTDRQMMYSLDTAFREWLKGDPLPDMATADNLLPFSGFSFNKEARPGRVFKAVTIERRNAGDVRINLPAIIPVEDITAPTGTVRVGITFMVASLPFATETAQKTEAAEVLLDYDNTKTGPLQIVLTDITASHCLSLVTMSMRFYRSKNGSLPIDQKRWKPTVIVSSFYN